MSEAGHALGEVARAIDLLGLVGEEIGEQGFEVGWAFPNFFELAIGGQVGEADGAATLAVDVPAEFEVIGEEQVFEGGEVAFELGSALDLVEGLADVFGFDVAEGQGADVEGFGDDEVGGAAGDVTGFVGDEQVGVEGGEEGVQGRAMGVLGGVTLGKGGFEVGEVGGGGGHGFLCCLYYMIEFQKCWCGVRDSRGEGSNKEKYLWKFYICERVELTYNL